MSRQVTAGFVVTYEISTETNFPPIYMPSLDLPEGSDVNSQFVGGTPYNLQKLLLRTKFHPNGRVQLDPETQRPKNPQHNTVYVREKPVYVATTEGHKMRIATRKINVNGGHVKGYHPCTGLQKDCVWRMVFSGPKKYHLLKLKEIQVRTLKNNPILKIAPDLTIEESEEYFMYLKYLEVSKKRIADDVEFYEWVEKNGVAVDEGEVVMGQKKSKETATDEAPAK